MAFGIGALPRLRNIKIANDIDLLHESLTEVITDNGALVPVTDSVRDREGRCGFAVEFCRLPEKIDFDPTPALGHKTGHIANRDLPTHKHLSDLVGVVLHQPPAHAPVDLHKSIEASGRLAVPQGYGVSGGISWFRVLAEALSTWPRVPTKLGIVASPMRVSNVRVRKAPGPWLSHSR